MDSELESAFQDGLKHGQHLRDSERHSQAERIKALTKELEECKRLLGYWRWGHDENGNIVDEPIKETDKLLKEK